MTIKTTAMKVWLKTQEGPLHVPPEGGILHGYFLTDDPIQAEIQYLRLIQAGHDGEVILQPRTSGVVAPARYCITFARQGEEDIERRHQMWVAKAKPTAAQVRAAVKVGFKSGRACAQALGVAERTLRGWTAGEMSCPPAAWALMLTHAGVHPIYMMRPPQVER